MKKILAAVLCTIFAIHAFAGESEETQEAFAKLAIAICEVPAKGGAHISTKPIVVTMGEERSELTPRRHEQSAVASFEKASSCVTARIYGQLGNNLFQVATASALAWDHQAEPHFPDFNSTSPVYQHVFFRCNNTRPAKNITCTWKEPSYAYHPIPYRPDMRIDGYFQSEKYFAHHRNRLLELFAPHPDDLAYIQKKYREVLDNPSTVGVQIRYYKWEFPTDDLYPQYGKDYLESAMALFPESSLFVVSSNNVDYARKAVPSWVKNVIFIQDEPNYIDFYLLSLCKHNIITNSSFGWWSAWLNQNPMKIVVRPAYWVKGLPTQDVCPEKWISVDAKYE